MVQIKQFAVERWMDDHENDAKHNLAETCCASISLLELLELSGDASPDLFDFSQKQVYGAIRGSEALRSNIAALYNDGDNDGSSPAPLSADQVLVSTGAIQANFLALYTAVGPGDHVICHYPTYQQLYSVPESLGAEVSLWRSREDEGWRLDLDELKALIQPNTKLIIINNPQNPTGAVLPRATLQGLVDIARSYDIAIHSDEVYRPLFHSTGANAGAPPSILSFGYDRAWATGSMSKAFSLAGIRLGWIASRGAAFLDACAAARDYTTISVSQLDDRVAAFALARGPGGEAGGGTLRNLLARNEELARRNLAAVDTFVSEHAWACEWTRPQAGTTAFVRFVDREGRRPVDDVRLCERLQETAGVMLVPGSRCFGDGVDFKGYVRLGYVQDEQVVADGLRALRKFMQEEYEKLPLAA